jgi:hypothetical protein
MDISETLATKNTEKTNTMSITHPTKKPGVNPGAWEG